LGKEVVAVVHHTAVRELHTVERGHRMGFREEERRTVLGMIGYTAAAAAVAAAAVVEDLAVLHRAELGIDCREVVGEVRFVGHRIDQEEVPVEHRMELGSLVVGMEPRLGTAEVEGDRMAGSAEEAEDIDRPVEHRMDCSDSKPCFVICPYFMSFDRRNKSKLDVLLSG